MKKLSNTEPELKISVAYKKNRALHVIVLRKLCHLFLSKNLRLGDYLF